MAFSLIFASHHTDTLSTECSRLNHLRVHAKFNQTKITFAVYSLRIEKHLIWNFMILCNCWFALRHDICFVWISRDCLWMDRKWKILVTNCWGAHIKKETTFERIISLFCCRHKLLFILAQHYRAATKWPILWKQRIYKRLCAATNEQRTYMLHCFCLPFRIYSLQRNWVERKKKKTQAK